MEVVGNKDEKHIDLDPRVSSQDNRILDQWKVR
jgi:hypothetical protein